MYARRLAKFGLIPLSLLCVYTRAASLPALREVRRELPVSLLAASTLPPVALSALQHELESLMGKAGYNLDWAPTASAQGNVSVELRGTCAVPTHASLSPVPAGLPMASTATADGILLPKTWVNCGAVRAILAPRITDQPAVRRDFLTGRAVARLIAHELYHVLTQERSHSEEGVAKESLGAADLLNETSNFDAATMRELQVTRHSGKAATATFR